MDEFINTYITSSAWADAFSPLPIPNPANPDDPLEPYGEGQNKITSILPAGNNFGNSSAENMRLHGSSGVKSSFAVGNMKYEDDILYCNERSSYFNLGDQASQPNLIKNEAYGRSCSLPDVIASTQTSGSFVSEVPHNTVVISSSIDNNGSSISNFSQVLGDAHSITSFPTSWHSSYSGVSSFAVQNKLQGFGFQEVNSSDDVFSKASLGSDTHLSSFNAMSLNQNSPHGFPSFHTGQQINLLSGALQSEKEENGLCMYSFPSRSPMSMNMAVVFNPLQFPTSSENFKAANQTNSSGARAQAAPTNANGCNGVNKPRARARRGQATDPHSIAERLRREKIAERMKNLQELVPSSNKTDKASMLDEIMDYVKFLQLQVKVLSMSRLGAAGAVLPLLANNQTEGSSSILVSSSAGGGAGIFESGDCLAFEQEVVKLMETNLTSAIQYLQNKGLCLMPIALATAISNHNGSNAAIPDLSTGMSSFYSHNPIERNLDSGVNSCNGDVAKQGVPKAA